MAWFLLVALFGLQSRAAETGPPDTIHSHEWAVRFEPQANVTFTQLADELAVAHGLINLGQVGPLEDVYHFMPTHLCHPTLHKAPKCWTRRKRRTAEDPSLHQRLDALPQVAWVEQQKVFRRHRRSVSKRGPEWSEDWEDRLTYTDPLYKDQWHLHNQGNDIHQGPTWLQGFTGRGVVVTVVDDGIEHNHPDLESNYDPEASYDLNSDDPDPQPRYSPSNINKHGTRCAGEIAAVANNQYCGVGVAYEAKVGGVRLIDGDVTDVLESRALGLNPQHISIYSSSWGPEDDGRTVEGPGPLVRATLLKGVREGRGGKG